MKKQIFARELLNRSYWQEKKSIPEIATELNVVPHIIYHQFKKLSIPRRTIYEANLISRYKYPNIIKPNLFPSKDLAYFLGVMKGDGSLRSPKCNGGKGVRLEVKSEEFAKSFYEVLKNLGLHPCFYFDDHKRMYIVVGYSFILNEWYRELDLNHLKSILDNNLELIRAFIRGFHESEGHFRCEERGSALIAVYNSNENLIDFVHELLTKIGYDFYKRVRHRPNRKRVEYSLELYRKEQIKHFLEEIKPCIKTGEITHQIWFKDEDEKLKSIYLTATKNEIIQSFPNRSFQAIKYRATHDLGLKRKTLGYLKGWMGHKEK